MRNPDDPDWVSGVAAWVPETLSVDPKFAAFVKVAYGAAVSPTDEIWTPRILADSMNWWERSVVQGRIGDMARASDQSNTDGIAVGAIGHFRAPWLASKIVQVEDGDFRSAAGPHAARRTVHRATMRRTDGTSDSVDIDTDDDVRIEFRLARPGIDPADALSDAASPGAREIEAAFAARIPVFGVESRADLRAALESTGIRRIFDPRRAELDCAVDGTGSRFVGAFVHASRVALDTEGINRPPRWAGGVREDPKPFSDSMTFDRPFFFFATEEETGAILYAGWVADVPVIERTR